jgi:hypothetical protein
MIETIWQMLPFPFWEIAAPQPVPPLEFPCILERLLEDAAGQAGVLVAAADHPETDQADVLYAIRVLSENLHATVTLWRQWHACEEPDEATEAQPPASAPGSPRARRGTALAGKEDEA